MRAAICTPKRGAPTSIISGSCYLRRRRDRCSIHSTRLPASPAPQDEYGPAYDTLKAYLITTSHHGYSTRAFLAPVLMRHWTAGRTVDPQRSPAGADAIRVLRERAERGEPVLHRRTTRAAIERGRRYLAQFAGTERVYQNMLADAGKTNPPIQFNRKFPGSAEVVVDTHEVSGAFTKGGWGFMKDALRHADKYFTGEQWVLGDQATANFDRAKLEQQLRDRYVADFIAQWRAYTESCVGGALRRHSAMPRRSSTCWLAINRLCWRCSGWHRRTRRWMSRRSPAHSRQCRSWCRLPAWIDTSRRPTRRT